MDAYSIIIKPHVTEKTMNLIDLNNEITFVVRRSANKAQIKKAFEELYEEKLEKWWYGSYLVDEYLKGIYGSNDKYEFAKSK